MKIIPSPPLLGTKLLPLAQSRQLSMRFETTSLQGVTAQQREAVTRALAAVLLQAAGVPVKVDDGRTQQAVYRCEHLDTQPSKPRCCTFGAGHPDEAVARELLRAVEPMAVDAARHAEVTFMQAQAEQRRI